MSACATELLNSRKLADICAQMKSNHVKWTKIERGRQGLSIKVKNALETHYKIDRKIADFHDNIRTMNKMDRELYDQRQRLRAEGIEPNIMGVKRKDELLTEFYRQRQNYWEQSWQAYDKAQEEIRACKERDGELKALFWKRSGEQKKPKEKDND